MLSLPTSLLITTMRLSAPLLLASMGGFTSERSGIINIALEGKMLVAACVAYIATLFTHSPILALMSAIAASTVLSVLHWQFTQKYRIDQIISGMAINALALGVTNYLYMRYQDPAASDLPKFAEQLYWTLALISPIALSLYLNRTRGGLRLFAVGNDPEKSRLIGVEPQRVRLLSLLATGCLTGIAGTLIFTTAGQFTEGMTAGRGYIALAALILGGWRPIPTLFACLGFGFLDALQLHLQGIKIAGASIPAVVFSSLPYVVTVIALAGLLGRSRAPAGLGKL